MPVQDHPHETIRLERLRSYGILDTPRELRFDRLVFMAAQIAKTPIALITFVDAERQWFKAQVGISIGETPRSDAFCAHAILGTGPFIVEDTRQDARFAESTLVTGAPFIRFYAGIPLFSADRLPLGSLCVIDRQARRLTTEQLRGLVALAREAEELLYPMDVERAPDRRTGGATAQART
jgi:GAF domain-containing protein